MTHPASIGSPLRERPGDTGVTLIEILVVLVLIGVAASVVGLGLNGRGRAASGLEREASLLAVRLEQAASGALERGVPAGFLWDTDGYGFVSLEDGNWAAHPNGVLGVPHRMESGLDVSVMGQTQGRFLIRPDLLPSRTVGEDNTPSVFTIEIISPRAAWYVVFDGVAARPQPALADRL